MATGIDTAKPGRRARIAAEGGATEIPLRGTPVPVLSDALDRARVQLDATASRALKARVRRRAGRSGRSPGAIWTTRPISGVSWTG